MKKENRFIIQAICFLGVLLEEIYFFQVYQGQTFLIAGGLVVLLVIFYFLFNSFLSLKEQWNEEKTKAQEEMIKRVVAELTEKREDDSRLEMVEKLEKAIYVSLNNSASMLQEELQQLDQHVAADFEALNTQLQETGERTAKINVKYGRENTKSLMVFQKKAFDNIVAGMEEMVNEVSAITEKMNTNLKQIEQAIKSNPVSTSVVGVEALAEPVETATEIEIPDMEMDTLANEAEPMVAEETEVAASEPEAIVTEEPEVAASESEPMVIEEPEVAVSEPEAMVAEEPEVAISESESIVSEEPEITDMEIAVEEFTPEPELSSDPNHVMTPEEIAALVSGTGNASAEEAVAEASEPEPMPELSSDPNHVMTPEEIAALIAGTN